MVSPTEPRRKTTDAHDKTSSQAAETGQRNRWTIVVGAVGGVIAIALVVAITQAGDDRSVTGTTVSAATELPDDQPPSSVTFAPDDVHASLPTDPGCDQLYFHSAMAMWNPVLADELLDYECPFPFEPDQVSMEGGTEDPSIAADYEPRRYQEIFDIVAAEQFGMCSVARLGEPSVRGFVYGFGTKLRAESCANNDPNVEVIVREYATRAHRDEAANSSVDTPDRTLVLGRWTITLIGDDTADIDRLARRFEAIGASSIEQ